MRYQRRDVDFYKSLERRDVDTQRHDVVSTTLWNVATFPRTSRRCPFLNPKPLHFFYSHPKPVLPEPKPSYTPRHTEPAPESYHTGRRLAYCFRHSLCTPTSPFHTTLHLLPALVLCSTLGLRVFKVPI